MQVAADSVVAHSRQVRQAMPQQGALAWKIESNGRSLVVTRQFARSFRDGSNGWLFCVEGSQGCTEMRAFPDGTVLTLAGLDRLAEADRADLVAAWPLLSPRVDADPDLLSSWPLGRDGAVIARVSARGGWRRSAGELSWTAILGAPGAKESGELAATVQIDGVGTKSAAWHVRYERCGADGACPQLERTGSLDRLVEPRPAQVVTPCPGQADPARAPLCLADGTVIADDDNGPGVLNFGISDTMNGER